MTTLTDISTMLKHACRHAGLAQEMLAQRAGVARTTVARMETQANNDMSVSALVRLLDAAGFDLRAVLQGDYSLERFLTRQRQDENVR